MLKERIKLCALFIVFIGLIGATFIAVSAEELTGYELGKAVIARKDYSATFRYWKQAAKAGDAKAQNALGVAADQGHVEAKQAMGRLGARRSLFC